MAPAFPQAQEQFLFCPTQLGPKLSESFYQAFSPGHPLSNLPWLSLWAWHLFYFQSQCWNLCCTEEDKTRDIPTFP